MEKIRLHRSYSARKNPKTAEIHFGFNPPLAFKIDDEFGFVETLIANALAPIEESKLIENVCLKHPLIAVEDIQNAIADLKRRRVIVPDWEVTRYDRHELYFSLSSNLEPGSYQETLANRKVALVGLGGIGSTCAMILAAAGVRNFILLDGDLVEATNLTRTTLFQENDIGRAKVDAVCDRLNERNSEVSIEKHATFLNSASADELKKTLACADILILSGDQTGIHSLVNRICARLELPWINAGYSEIYGAVGPMIIPGVTACFECEMRSLPVKQSLMPLNDHYQAPSYGPLNALVASAACNETIRFLTGVGNAMLSRRWLIHSVSYETQFQTFSRHAGCETCGVVE